MQYLSFHRPFWDTGTFWVTVAVVLFLLAFGRQILNGILGAVDKRSAAIQHELDEAQRLRREAEIMLTDAQTRQAEALRAAQEMVEHARARAQRLTEELSQAAAAAQARREAVLHERIQAAQANAIAEVRAAAATLAVDAVTRVLSETFGPDQDAPAIDHAIASLPAALGSRRAA